VQDGCGVTVAMTHSAQQFVGATTFRGLTGRAVLTSLWGSDGTEGQARRKATERRSDEGGCDSGGAMQHLEPGAAADLIIVAPATANILGKLANGIADDLVSTLLLGADSPVLLAPAMNVRMWRHPAVQRNVEFLREHGFVLVGPEEGWLACGDVGPGRMSEPETVLAAAREQLLARGPKRLGDVSE
jgi:phosphopantothenoylcysteine decarboxylase